MWRLTILGIRQNTVSASRKTENYGISVVFVRILLYLYDYNTTIILTIVIDRITLRQIDSCDVPADRCVAIRKNSAPAGMHNSR